ncbi:hypothetical protein [Lacimicrobium alkaliphilum]|nr:hypothetical protein [Lacimicrobium alkaliphilum]
MNTSLASLFSTSLLKQVARDNADNVPNWQEPEMGRIMTFFAE